MAKKLIRLTESDIHRIVKESVNRVLQEAWADDYYAMRDKKGYENDLKAYKASPWYKRLLKMVMRQNPQDPNPEKTAKQLAQQYVDSFEKEHTSQSVGNRIDYPGGKSMYNGIGYDSETYEPVISSLYYNGSTAFGDRKGFDDKGNTEQWGIQYPYSEYGITGRPTLNRNWGSEEHHADVDRLYKGRDDMEDEIRDVIRKYKPRRR